MTKNEDEPSKSIEAYLDQPIHLWTVEEVSASLDQAHSEGFFNDEREQKIFERKVSFDGEEYLAQLYSINPEAMTNSLTPIGRAAMFIPVPIKTTAVVSFETGWKQTVVRAPVIFRLTDRSEANVSIRYAIAMSDDEDPNLQYSWDGIMQYPPISGGIFTDEGAYVEGQIMETVLPDIPEMLGTMSVTFRQGIAATIQGSV